MIKEFKEFLMQGNVLDLAVGVVIGGAFTAIVKAFVEGLITPLVLLVTSFIPGVDPNKVATMALEVNGITFSYGLVLNAIITFVITAFVIFMVVKLANRAQRSIKGEPEAEVEVELATTESLLAEIRDLLATQENNKPSI